jgi:choline dehydrogenase-like flavoprotein
MTASATFEVVFVGAGHNDLVAARYLAENSSSVCLLGQRRRRAHPRTAPCESFMDDPDDFKKRSRTVSPHENPTSQRTYGRPSSERLTATRVVIASATYDWLCRRLLRDALGVAESTRAQGRRDG